jgi:hypothetical protein
VFPAILLILLIAAYVEVPVMLVWGWRRWARRPRQKNPFATISFISFSIGTASALLLVVTILWSLIRGGFTWYDPVLLRIFAVGLLLSILGFLIALGGVWKANPLRWHAPALALGMVLIWAIWTAGE